ncbi:MAG TPA: EAL domain-containing protein, partial [Caulobacteraceae bacterium]|nr:EAL domain-containing protein [Caulobacteraceae bacterium]
RAGDGPRSVAVNVSASNLLDTDLPDQIATMLAIRGLPGEALTVEITEGVLMADPDRAGRVLRSLRALGVGISIDDYGTGLSSLAYLKQIAANELKIDKAFVLGVSDSGRDALLLRSTIDLAHSLGLKVTAEGVETDTAFALLAGMGCDLAQGYLIARPMPLKELLMFLREDKQANKRYG